MFCTGLSWQHICLSSFSNRFDKIFFTPLICHHTCSPTCSLSPHPLSIHMTRANGDPLQITAVWPGLSPTCNRLFQQAAHREQTGPRRRYVLQSHGCTRARRPDMFYYFTSFLIWLSVNRHIFPWLRFDGVKRNKLCKCWWSVFSVSG